MLRMEKNDQHGFLIQTQVNYLPDQSDESDNRFVFSYTISITNLGNVAAKLISRHWIITDAHNHVQEVRGQGVVGEQPLLKPSQSFEYTSGTVLTTRSAQCAAATRCRPKMAHNLMSRFRNLF